MSIGTSKGKIGLGLFLLLVVGYYGIAFALAPVNADAGFLLSTAARLWEGMVPYRDIQLGYTPLGVGILAMGKLLPDTYGYAGYLGIIYLTHIACAGIVGKSIERLTHDSTLAWLGALCFLLIAFNFEASLISLEPFVAFFALLAWYLLGHPRQKWGYILGAGICAGASFLAKQYGLAIMAPLLISIGIERGERRIEKMLILVCGWLLLPLGIALYYHWSLEYGLGDLWKNWLMPGFGANPDSPTVKEIGRTWLTFMGLYFPGVFLAVVTRKYWSRDLVGIAIAAVSFSSPLIFGLFPHYFLMNLPFYVLFTVTLYHKLRLNKRTRKIFVILMLVSFSWSTVRAASIVRYLWNAKHQREFQWTHAHSLTRWISPGERVLVLGAHFQSLYYLGEYKPVLAAQVGYTFPEHFKEQELNALFQESSWILIQQKDRDQSPLYSELLTRHDAKCLASSFYGVEVWKIERYD